jgi:hypothetical protein
VGERVIPGRRESNEVVLPVPVLGQEESCIPATNTGVIAGFIRDSAIVISLVTALLYLASHVFGVQYLGIFEIGAGFQGIGLANLAMIPFELSLGLLIFAAGVYATLTASRPWVFVLGVAAMLAIGSTRTICVLAYGVEMAIDDAIPFFVSGMTCIVLASIHVLIIRRMPKLDEIVPELAAETEKLEQAFAKELARLPEVKRLPLLERRYASKREELARLTAKAQSARWKYRIALAVVSAYFTAIFALPSAATILALGATASDRWVSTTDGAVSRVPVYWVDNRVVYLTTESGTCFVSVQIEGVLQTKRECSPLVAALKR